MLAFPWSQELECGDDRIVVSMEIVPSGGTLNQMVRRIHRLHSLPAAALRVLDLTRKDDVDPRVLRECVEIDPANCAKILAVVNGSISQSGSRVINLGQAIALLGVRRLQLLILGMSLPAGLFNGVESSVLSHYWRFSLYKSFAAKRLAQRNLNVEDADATFVVALLHDCGMLAMIQELGAPYLDFLQHILGTAGPSILSLETETLGFDHRILGAKLMAEWQLPDLIVDLTRQRLDAPAIQELTDPVRSMAQAIHVADLLAHFWILRTTELGAEVARLADVYWGMDAKSMRQQFNVCFGVPEGATGSASEEEHDGSNSSTSCIEKEVLGLAQALSVDHDDWPHLTSLIRSAHDQLALRAEEFARSALSGWESENNPNTCAPELPPSTSSAPMQEVLSESRAATPHMNRSTATESSELSASWVPPDAPPTMPRPTKIRQDPGPQVKEVPSSTAAAEPAEPTPTSTPRIDLPEFLQDQLDQARSGRNPLSLVIVELQPLDQWVLLRGPNVADEMADELGDRLRNSSLADPLLQNKAIAIPVSPSVLAMVVATDDRLRIAQWANRLPEDLSDLPPFGLAVGTKLPNLWFGISAMSYVPKGFDPTRLIEPAERCLRAAQQLGGSNAKSIDVL